MQLDFKKSSSSVQCVMILHNRGIQLHDLKASRKKNEDIKRISIKIGRKAIARLPFFSEIVI